MSLEDLTIVVCTKNSERLIRECLENIKKEARESELIVIDADSTDRTLEIAKGYPDKIISDHKKGLSYARQLGIDSAKNNLVAFVGVDDSVPRETLIDLIREIENDEKIAGVQPLTIVKDPKNYWEWSTKYIFEMLLNKIGFAEVIGTPCIFRRKVVSLIRYDEDIRGGTDDTFLCLKLTKAGYKLKKIHAYSFEKQNLNFKSFLKRWKFYGQGDGDFYRKNKKDWNLRRKIKSISHPFVKYICKGSLIAIRNNRIAIIPALILATFARYYGWVTRFIKSKNLII